MNATAIRALVRNDLRLYVADRRAVIVSVLVPILIAAFFGYIFGGTGRNDDQGKIPIAVVDEDQTSVSRAITADLAADPLLQVSALDRAAAREQVKAGKQNAAAVFPKGFGEQTTQSLFSGRDKPQVELLVDPSQTMGARVIEGLLAQYSMQEISKEAFNGSLGREAIDRNLEQLDQLEQTPLRADVKTLLGAARRLNEQIQSGAAGTQGAGAGTGEQRNFGLSIPYTVASTPVTARDKTPYNSYAHSFAGMSVQGILFGGIEAGVLLLLTRQRGIWQRLRSAPLSRGEFMLARALATTLISVFQIAVIYLVAVLVFHARRQRIDDTRSRDDGDALAGHDWRRVGARIRVPALAAERVALHAHALGDGRVGRRHVAGSAFRRRCAAHRGADGQRPHLPAGRDLALSLGGIVDCRVEDLEERSLVRLASLLAGAIRTR
jgi:ABC-2 type transport system permease protein